MEQHYQVTARKWRPQRFDEVVGQDHITRTLKNSIRENRLAHAYLFTGQRGCGKTTVARILAKAINCPNAAEHGYEPCNECDNCKAITGGSSMDVAEIDGASNNGVEDVRSMRENVKYPPLQGKYRVIIIDEVHMLSSSAFNALLKTLEEPPRHLVFIFATTEVQKLPSTILSRTQRYDFRRMQIEEIVKQLRHIATSDGITTDDDALLLIAKKADGSMRDGQSIFDQAVAVSGANLLGAHLREALNLIDAEFYFECTDAIAAHESSKAFELVTEVITRGYDIEEFIGGLLDHFRNFLTVIATHKPDLLEVVKHHQEKYVANSEAFSEGDIIRLIQIGFRAIERLKTAPSPRIVLELMLVEMTLLDRSIEIRSLLDEIRAMKASIGTMPTPQPLSAAQSRSTTPASKTNPPISETTATRSTAISSSATLSDLTEKWDEFISSVSERSVPFRMVASDVTLGQVQDKSIELLISKNHTDETFSRNKDKFTGYLREFFNEPSLNFSTKKVEKKTVDAAKAAAPRTAKPSLDSSAPTPLTVDDGIERSELEIALMKELGAIPL